MMERKTRRKVFTGTVESDKGEKTITVKVLRTFRHTLYKRVIRRSVRFHAHDEKNESRAGDVVQIMETRPLSKTKRWRLVKVVEKAK